MLDGQKLQGPPTAADVYQYLEQKAANDEGQETFAQAYDPGGGGLQPPRLGQNRYFSGKLNFSGRSQRQKKWKKIGFIKRKNRNSFCPAR